MKKKLFLPLLILFGALILNKCSTTSSTLKYKIVKVGDASEAKTISFVKINNGSFYRLYPSTVNQITAGDISCPLSSNQINTLYFVLVRPVSPYDTLHRTVFMDTIRNCILDLTNYPPGSGTYYKNKTLRDSIPVSTYQQVVTWPPSKSDTTEVR